ncbi:unnamed protein product [Microthlaspi erraticum]|uniref:MULE transposase domain-containing protein n=1 Tax=Microthlaspi erraticum TaxID=1685480 RepID=A0A6D2JQ00_9BRAS|nr:unnamed protein product [Microthlaspi erraticum]
MCFNPNVHFQYGGSYSRGEEGLQWVTRNPSHAISFKTSSVAEITYSDLVDKILKKIAVVGANPELKLSYIPLVNKPVIESYIFDDDDLYAYLTTLDKEGFRSVMHVEVMKGLETNKRREHTSRTEAVSSYGLNYEDPVENDGDLRNSGMLTIYRARGEGEEEHRAPIIEEVVSDGNENGENGVCCESNGLDNHARYYDLPRSAEERQYVTEWDDGTGLEIGQEFCSREALQDLVDRASNKNCFGFLTYKSDLGRLILECRQKSIGCKWYLRATNIKGSSLFAIRVYRKMHTCSRAAQSSSTNRRRGTPRLVASVLHEDYPGQFDTPAPKNIVGLVQRRVGLSVSYSTALRGKRLAVNDVRGNPEEGYMMLYSYLYMLEKVNPGSVTSVKLDILGQFQYLFIALGASIEGFRSMRKVIVVDSTFLKTVYGGQLVFASAQDPNHHHYPIVFGVIDGENHASWSWFLGKLKTVIPDDHELVFMSDKA